MKNLKLEIDLLPKGAWGNNLSNILPPKDWDIIRNYCYEKANKKCEICGFKTNDLDAHEEWEFDIPSKKQTLKNIIALCSACHGVKHFRNSNRIGYGENAIRHFLKTNNCGELDLAAHITKEEMLFEERNAIYRWKVIADLSKFGGKGINFEPRNIPMIKNPYENIDFKKVNFNEAKSLFILSENEENLGPPYIYSIDVDNYRGIISINSYYVNKIEWFLDDKNIKTKFNIDGEFKTDFKVENLEGIKLWFKLTGEGGVLISKQFELQANEDNKTS